MVEHAQEYAQIFYYIAAGLAAVVVAAAQLRQRRNRGESGDLHSVVYEHDLSKAVTTRMADLMSMHRSHVSRLSIQLDESELREFEFKLMCEKPEFRQAVKDLHYNLFKLESHQKQLKWTGRARVLCSSLTVFTGVSLMLQAVFIRSWQWHVPSVVVCFMLLLCIESVAIWVVAAYRHSVMKRKSPMLELGLEV